MEILLPHISLLGGQGHWSSSSESLWCIWSLPPEVYFMLERQIQLSGLVAPGGYSPPANNPIDSHYGSKVNSIKCALSLECVALNSDAVGLVQTCNVLAKKELIPLRLFLVSKHYLPRCDFARVHKPFGNHAWVDTVYWICVTFYKQERTFSWIPAPGYWDNLEESRYWFNILLDTSELITFYILILASLSVWSSPQQ